MNELLISMSDDDRGSENTDAKSWGAELKAFRLRCNVTSAMVSNMLCAMFSDPGYIMRVESGKRDPPLQMKRAIYQTLIYYLARPPTKPLYSSGITYKLSPSSSG